MSSRKYWYRRYEQLAAANQQRSADYERRFAAQTDVLYQQMEAELESWYRRYGRVADVDADKAAELLKDVRTKNWDMTLDEFERKARLDGYDDELDLVYIKSRVARLQQLESQLQEQGMHAAPKLADSMRQELKSSYKRTYEHATYLNEMAGGVTGNFADYNDTALEMAVSNPWGDGQNFSQRVWGKMQKQLPEMLMNTVAQSIVLGHGVNKVVDQLAKKYGEFKRGDLHRLVQTEMAHIDESATMQSYSDSGVEYYQYMATLESRTCSVCGHLDGHHFPVARQVDGQNYPPIHPYCRCTTAAWFPDLPIAGKRWSKDSVTGKRHMVDAMNFDLWKKDQYVRHESGLVGLQTSDGLMIKQVTRHQVERMLQREVTVEEIKDALNNPLHITDVKTDNQGRKSKNYIGNESTVTVNPDTGAIISVRKTGKRGRKKYGKKSK